MEKSMEIPQKIKNRTTIRSSNTTSEHISKINESRLSKRHLHSHVYGSIIHNSQAMVTTVTYTLDMEKDISIGQCMNG